MARKMRYVSVVTPPAEFVPTLVIVSDSALCEETFSLLDSLSREGDAARNELPTVTGRYPHSEVFTTAPFFGV